MRFIPVRHYHVALSSARGIEASDNSPFFPTPYDCEPTGGPKSLTTSFGICKTLRAFFYHSARWDSNSINAEGFLFKTSMDIVSIDTGKGIHPSVAD
jgi:hypothetical protein